MIIKATVLACLSFYLLLNSSLAYEEQIIKSASNITAGKKFFLGSDNANFFQAFFRCKDGDMDLASINSRQDEQDLAYFLRNVDKTGGQYGGFWLSGTNLPNVNSTQYYWLTGGKPVIYNNWLPGEPNNDGGVEHCLQWAEILGVQGWNDYSCENERRYICQEAA